jgi:hypothetical protein
MSSAKISNTIRGPRRDCHDAPRNYLAAFSSIDLEISSTRAFCCSTSLVRLRASADQLLAGLQLPCDSGLAQARS